MKQLKLNIYCDCELPWLDSCLTLEIKDFRCYEVKRADLPTCKFGYVFPSPQAKNPGDCIGDVSFFFFRNSNYVTLTIELVLHVTSFPDYSFHARQEGM